MCSFIVSGIHVNIHWHPVDLYLLNIYFLLDRFANSWQAHRKTARGASWGQLQWPVTVTPAMRERPIHGGRIAVDSPNGVREDVSLFAQ